MVFCLSDIAQPPIHLGWSAPFVFLLAAIALMPFTAGHWWEKHYPKIALGLGVVPAIYYFLVARAPEPWMVAMEDYAGFILLLASLYIVSGGIAIRINRKATPLSNCSLLALGAVLANVFGTTGASMLLIRPYLHMNRGHVKPFHVVFFIMIVSNCGGLLTPIGDPPLFLGYIEGIPFGWTVEHLWPIWAFCNGVLLAVFYVMNRRDHRDSPRTFQREEGPQVHILGIHNLLFIALILVAVFRPGFFAAVHRMNETGIAFQQVAQVIFSRELLLVASAAISLVTTPRAIYQRNEFHFGPMKEVIVLFAGIFSTMTPALGYLQQHASRLHLDTPGQFFVTTGALSAVLDNAPTYLTFLRLGMSRLDEQEVAQAQQILTEMSRTGRVEIPGTLADGRVRRAVETAVEYHADLIRDNAITSDQLRVAFLLGDARLNALVIAVSAGAVLFGACTYVGNGPNFMVKSIAESHGSAAPGFIRYIVCYTLPILIPLYVVIWLIFLR